MRKQFSRLLGIIMSVIVLFSSGQEVALADSNLVDDNKINISTDDYLMYTIDFESSEQGINQTPDEILNEAIDFVKSLKLSSLGYGHIEEACIAELKSYIEDNVILEKYTVLVPKRNTMYYYGTYSGYDFYYENTSVSNMRRETNGEAKNSSNAAKWNNWILGAMDLGMCFSSWQWGIPYSIIRNVTGVSGTAAVHNGSYNQHVEQFTNTVTRTIFKERSSTNYDPSYQDQTSSLRVNLYFCPVGTAFSSDYIYIGNTFTGTVKANNLSKNQIMQQANVYSNHGGEIIYRVSYIHLSENWN